MDQRCSCSFEGLSRVPALTDASVQRSRDAQRERCVRRRAGWSHGHADPAAVEKLTMSRSAKADEI